MPLVESSWSPLLPTMVIEVGFWELAVQKNPGSLHAWHMRGLTLIATGEPEAGKAALRTAWDLGHDPQTRAVLDRVAN